MSVRLRTLIFFDCGLAAAWAGDIKLPATESLQDRGRRGLRDRNMPLGGPNGEARAVNFPLCRKPDAKFRCYAIARTEEKRGLAYLGCHYNRATTLAAGVQSFVFPEGSAKCRIWKRTEKRRWNARVPPMACKILASASGYLALQAFTWRLPITLITSMSTLPGTGATKTKICTRTCQRIEFPRSVYL